MMQQKENKRKRNSLTISQRREILGRLEEGEPAISIANAYSIAPSTVAGIKKSKDEIIRRIEVIESCQGNLDKKRYRGTEESQLEKSLYNWVRDQRELGAPVSGPAVQEIAKKLNEDLSERKNFTASMGWFRRFKSRHDIGVRQFPNRKQSKQPKDSHDMKAAEVFKSSFGGLLELTGVEDLDNIYNCDETGLYWKSLPSKTFSVAAGKEIPGFEKSRARVTVVACSNGSGTHKIPLYVIGKSTNPPNLNEINQSPVKYTEQSNGWMDKDLMLTWFQDCFLPAIRQKNEENRGIKIILLIDSATCHPPAEHFHKLCDFCTVIFLPENTSFLQPMEQGITKKFKRSYRNALLRHLIIEQSSSGFANAYSSLKISDCFRFCSSAWNDISQSDIRNCWKPLVPLNGDSLPSVSDLEITDTDFQRLLSLIPGCSNISQDDVKHWLIEDKYLRCVEMAESELSQLNSTPSPEDSDDDRPHLAGDSSEKNSNSIITKHLYDYIKLIINWSSRSDDEVINKIADVLEPYRCHIERKIVSELLE